MDNNGDSIADVFACDRWGSHQSLHGLRLACKVGIAAGMSQKSTLQGRLKTMMATLLGNACCSAHLSCKAQLVQGHRKGRPSCVWQQCCASMDEWLGLASLLTLRCHSHLQSTACPHCQG